MAYEKKDNSGILFANDRKEPGSQQPDRTGNAIIDGREYWISGWVKQGAKGYFMSLSFKPKDEQTRVPGSKNTPIDLDDKIPF